MTKPRILIVDDEKNVRNAIKRWFELSGFDVDQADDGFSAVEKCTQTSYDIITMDLEMPRMNGLEAIIRIKVIQPEVPVIVLTGFHARPEEIYDLGATRILAKPLSLRELEQEVRSILGEAANR